MNRFILIIWPITRRFHAPMAQNYARLPLNGPIWRVVTQTPGLGYYITHFAQSGRDCGADGSAVEGAALEGAACIA